MNIPLSKMNMKMPKARNGDMPVDDVVELIGKDEFIADPLDAYENKIFCKGAPLKTGVIWNKKYIEEEK